MRVPIEKFDDILRSGIFKNQHATRTTRGSFNPDGREAAERWMFGIPPSSDPGDYPVYGYIRTQGYEGRVDGYGDIRVTFKDSVKNRTSFVFGDSLGDGMRGDIVPAPLNDPHEGNITQFADVNRISRRFGIKENMGAIDVSYVEAQIHGPLTPDDIEFVELVGWIRWDEPAQKELIDLLEELGIPYGIITEEDDNVF